MQLGHNFLNVLYLRAYKEGYEQFVLPHIDQFDTNMHTFTPDQITNSTDLCDIMIEKDAIYMKEEFTDEDVGLSVDTS